MVDFDMMPNDGDSAAERWVCLTCPEEGDGYPGTLFFPPELSDLYPDDDVRSINYHAQRGHSVKELD